MKMTITVELKDGRYLWFGKPLEFGEGTQTQWLWDDDYRVSLGKFWFIHYLIFKK